MVRPMVWAVLWRGPSTIENSQFGYLLSYYRPRAFLLHQDPGANNGKACSYPNEGELRAGKDIERD